MSQPSPQSGEGVEESGASLAQWLRETSAALAKGEQEGGDSEDFLCDGCEVPTESVGVHVVLLGDSTLDNGRYLNHLRGEMSVEKQLARRCEERSWCMTNLAQDGAVLDDVLQRQVPLIPREATHLVVSASGNDLLTLLNGMVVANFSLGSVYAAIGQGLTEVAERYRNLLQILKSVGCHFACCTVYRPNFSHLFFRSLASMSLGLYNARIRDISVDLDCSVIDLAGLFSGPEDFANPLELSTHGGAKVVENISAFVSDHAVVAMRRHRPPGRVASGPAFVEPEDSAFQPAAWLFGVPMRCCATSTQERKVYAIREVSQDLQHTEGDATFLAAHGRLEFSEAQERWRET